MTATATLVFLQEDVFAFSVSQLLATTVEYAGNILIGFIIASILINLLFPGYPSSPFFQVVFDAVKAVVDPILRPLRSRIPPIRLGGFGLDLSPMIAIIGVIIAQGLLSSIIRSFIQPVTG